MDIQIQNAILHIMDNVTGQAILSDHELDTDSEACQEFIIKHVRKLLNNPASKDGVFLPQSQLFQTIQQFQKNEIHFKEASIHMCRHLFSIMEENTDIPPADILIVYFNLKGIAYMAIFKLNYKACYTHQINGTEGKKDNQLVLYKSVLPFDQGKVEEACLIPFEPMVLKILEKPYLVQSESRYYFSELFLECAPALSKKEIAQIIQETTDEVNEKYFKNDLTRPAMVKQAIVEESEEDEGNVSVVNVAARSFGDNPEAKQEFIRITQECGIGSETNLGEKFAKQQFGYHKIKAANGVEIKLPAELACDGESIQYITNPDGTTSILLNHVGEIETK